MTASVQHALPPWRIALRVLRRAIANFAEDRCTQMSAAISYFALFSMFPITMLAVSIFGIVLRDEEVERRVLEWIVDGIPIEDSSVRSSLQAVADLGPTLTIVSLFGALWTASALSSAVQRALNTAFDVDEGRPLLHAKLIDYTLLPVIGMLFLSSIVLTATWRVAQANASTRFGFVEGQFSWAWDLGALAIPGLLTFASFLFIYWFLPNRAVRVRDLWPGALLAAVMFEAVKAGFATYLANFANYDVVYGSLGGVIALMFWVYVSANILLFGAEVAAEVPHVRLGEARHGHRTSADDEGDWRSSLWALLRGLVLAPGSDGREAASAVRPAGAGTEQEEAGATPGADDQHRAG